MDAFSSLAQVQQAELSQQQSGPPKAPRLPQAPVLRSAAFSLVFAGAVLLGRASAMDGTGLSLLWPAAGVAAAWFAVQRDAGTRWLDRTLLALLTWSLAVAVGTGTLLAVFLAATALVQAEVFVTLVRRWCPESWGAGGQTPLTDTRALARASAAGLAAAVAGALVGSTATAVDTDRWSWLVLTVWLVRDSASILLGTVAVLRVGHAVSVRRGHSSPDARPRQLPPLVPSGWRAFELAAVLLASALAYGGVFWLTDGLPLAFLPLTSRCGSRCASAPPSSPCTPSSSAGRPSPPPSEATAPSP